MSWLNQSPHLAGKAAQYAMTEDFRRVFLDDVDGLFQLSLLLTADPEKAEQCFVAGLEESLESNRVFRDWVRPWAKVAVIKNAIRAVQPRSWQPKSSSDRSSSPMRDTAADDGSFDLGPLLALPDFERFVFVMSVLETYSDHDCSLLLDCSLQDVRNARIRALTQITQSVRKDSFAVTTMNIERDLL